MLLRSRKPWLWLVGAYLVALAGVAGAQAATGIPAPETGADGSDREWSVGLGAGIVVPDKSTETYLAANLRRFVGVRKQGVRGIVEAEVGYWKGTAGASRYRDLLLGVNLVASVPTGSADIFIGVGFGEHFTKLADETRARFGANIHFGVEMPIGERFGAFGAGRIDFVQGEPHRQQAKMWGGVRARF